MNKVLIPIGTSVLSFYMGAVVVLKARSVNYLPTKIALVGIAVGAAGLGASTVFLDKGKSLTKKDVVLIGSAGLGGAVLGGTFGAMAQTIFGLSALTYAILVNLILKG